jgi:hypothetical protein
LENLKSIISGFYSGQIGDDTLFLPNQIPAYFPMPGTRAHNLKEAHKMIQIFLLILVFSAWQSFGQINNLDAVSDSLVKDIPPDVNLVWLGESHGTKLNTE